uniref:Uncharacterized protein n=1 Tax=Anguilla anguilla TaxID=7936 RepID=A0A0E9VU08_ANGAN
MTFFSLKFSPLNEY